MESNLMAHPTHRTTLYLKKILRGAVNGDVPETNEEPEMWGDTSIIEELNRLAEKGEFDTPSDLPASP